MSELDISTDVETDGPIPVPHSHAALDGAIEQRALFCNLPKDSRCA